MKPASVTPRDVEREFRAEEIFFSTTDTRGIITAGNEVFKRISGYGAEELIGRPHNLVRHPDMPRAAFRLVWDYLGKSRRAVALVKNLAKDGCNYWVVALIVPAPGGYLSIRFKPTGPLRDSVAEIYAAMLAEEQRLRASGAGEKEGMDAAAALLTAAVRKRGFADYDEFMRVLLCEELRSRDAVLARTGGRVIRPMPVAAEQKADGEALNHLCSLYRQGAHVYALLSRLYERLDEFVALRQTLAGKADFVYNLTKELRLAAMNVALASTRIGGEGESLSVISHYMGSSSDDVAKAVHVLTSGITDVSKRLRSVIFNLAAGRLQIETIMAFLHELITTQVTTEEDRTQQRLIGILQHAFNYSLGHASQALHDLEHSTRELNPTALELSRHMLALHVAQVGGRVETTRLTEQQDAFAAVFSDIRGQIESTRGQLGELSDAVVQLDTIATETPATAREIMEAARQMEGDIAQLSVGAASGSGAASSTSKIPAVAAVAPTKLGFAPSHQPTLEAVGV